MIDLVGSFSLFKNNKLKKWKFIPNDNVESTSYSISFFEVDNEQDAWITLYLAIKKDKTFKIN